MPSQPPDDLLASLPDPDDGLERTASGRVVRKQQNLPLLIGLSVGAVGLLGVALTVALGDSKGAKADAEESPTASATPEPSPVARPTPVDLRPPPRRDDPGERLRAFTEQAWTLAQEGKFRAAIDRIEAAPAALKQTKAWAEVAVRDLKRYRAMAPLETKFERALKQAQAKQTKRLQQLLIQLEDEHGDQAFARVWRERARKTLGEEAFDALVNAIDPPPVLPDGGDPKQPGDPALPAYTPPELTQRGSEARRKRFAAAAAAGAKRLAEAKAALAERRRRDAKRLSREERRVKKATRSRKRGRWARTRVTGYSADGFVIKHRGKETRHRWETCPADLGYAVRKLAIDVGDPQRLLDLGLYALERGLFDAAQRTLEQVGKRSPKLGERLAPTVRRLGRLRQDAKVFRGRNDHKPTKPAGELTTVKWTFDRDRPQELRDVVPFDRRIRVGPGPDQQLLIQLRRARAPLIGAQLRGEWEETATLSLKVAGADPPPCVFVASSAGRYTLRFGTSLDVREFLDRGPPLAEAPLPALKAGSRIEVALTPKDARAATLTVSVDGKRVHRGALPAWGRLAFAVGAWTAGKPGQVAFDDVRIKGRLSRAWAARVAARSAYERARLARLLRLRLDDPKGEERLPSAFAVTSAEDEVGLEGLAGSLKQLLTEGREALRGGSSRKAAAAFRRAAETAECAAAAYLYARMLMLAAGQPETALVLLERAIAGVEDFHEALVAKAAVLARLGRRAEARETLDQALKLRPDYAPAYLAEAELRVHAGEYAAALDVVALAGELSPGDPLVAFTRDRIRALAAGPAWAGADTVETEHYRLRSDTGDPAQLGRQLETIRTRYAELVPPNDADGKRPRLEVLVFDDPGDYYRYVYATRGRRASSSTGQFNPWSGQLLLFLTQADRRRLGGSRELFHEAFHQWCYAEGVVLPFWLHEGLAVYAAGTSLSSDGRRIAARGEVDGDALDLLRLLVTRWSDRAPSWLDLMTQPPQAFFRRRVALKHAQAWSIAQFVFEGKDDALKQAFQRYLRRVQELPADKRRKGARLEQAYVETLHSLKSMPKVERAWAAWVAKLAKQHDLPAPE